jgi:hypothetical protein
MKHRNKLMVIRSEIIFFKRVRITVNYHAEDIHRRPTITTAEMRVNREGGICHPLNGPKVSPEYKL